MNLVVGVAVAALAAGSLGGFFVRPQIAPDQRVGDLERENQEKDRALDTQKARADQLAKDLDATTESKKELEAQLEAVSKEKAQLAEKAAESGKEMSKLKDALDKAGEVSANGDEITLQLVDKVLFKLGDDQLTDRGKAVLARVGKALEELPDKQIWVQGHTDDTPILQPKPPKLRKGSATKGEEPPAPKFASNWELSAARALTVVHYLQDQAKLDPTRLAALAFGEYRPVSRSNKALNRRIEIVLYPKKSKLKR